MLEIRRKIFHALTGISAVVLIYLGIFTSKVLAGMLFLGIALFFIHKRSNIRILSFFINLFEREKDRKSNPGRGALFFLAGVFLAVLIFPKDIAMASIMILALGDSIAPLIGRYGKIKHPLNNLRFLEGTIAGIIAGGLGALIFVSPAEAFLGSFVAMTFETIEITIHKKIDDNIVIPFVAGGIIWIMRML